jgi:hypothetical protein
MGSLAKITLVVLILLGGIRTTVHIRSAILYGLQDETAHRVKSIDSCDKFFGENSAVSSPGGDKDDDVYADVPSTPPGELSKCETWFEGGQQILDRFIVWHMILWIAGAFIGIATLLVAFLVFRRSSIAGKVMLYIFCVQVLAGIGEVVLSILRTLQNKQLMTALWPQIDSQAAGWFLVNGEMLGTSVLYVVACLVYGWLTAKVRCKKIWPPNSLIPGVSNDA